MFELISELIELIAFPEESHEKCIPKSEANDIWLSCAKNETIAIYEAFFTTSARHRCSQSSSVTTERAIQTDEDEDNMYAFPRLPAACTDDIRLSLNRKCSSAENCSFNLMKDHNQGCIGEDGSLIIRYTCISAKKFHPFCNLNLSESYGYISTPGYPRFYPPYESCVWNIEAGEGQVIQIDILDVAIREPESKTSVYNRKKVEYKCTDRLLLTESNRSDKESDSDGNYISDILIPIVLMIALLIGNAVIVWVLFRIKRRQKRTDDKTIESTVPLNSGSGPQTSV
ncbi:unnamed protein product [Oppiella nova]|uniref:CUB domain-containing protein n=1 Tax=Oppiella nova TaxID=334625 RepID=A0A7R9M5U4_9ACAR|nr:unnamed protein product [Oppiella nova]CAG2171208.1 unnamed protein product [Oppiella nova]